MKQEYTAEINRLVEQCDNLELLDLISQLLRKAGTANA
jgi:hypothetical protein